MWWVEVKLGRTLTLLTLTVPLVATTEHISCRCKSEVLMSLWQLSTAAAIHFATTTGENKKLISRMKLILKTLYKMKTPKTMKTCEKGAVTLASELLKAGKVIALPTDTIYGLACSANDPEAIKSLYEIKGRNEGKPVAICVSDYSDLKHWGCADHLPMELMKKLLPGPVTIVLAKSRHLSNPFLNPGVDKIGIRIPDFNFIRDVCRDFNQPMALTSANRSSEKSSLNITEFENLWTHLSAVFDGGSLSEAEDHRAGSTVIDLSEANICKVIRQGISYESTVYLLKQFNINVVWRT